MKKALGVRSPCLKAICTYTYLSRAHQINHKIDVKIQNSRFGIFSDEHVNSEKMSKLKTIYRG